MQRSFLAAFCGRVAPTVAALAIFSSSDSLAAGGKHKPQPPGDKAVAIHAPPPEYPAAATDRGLTGSGVFKLTVDRKTGVVLSISTAKSTGHAILDNAAMRAFRKWRFKPGTSATVFMPIAFTISMRR